MSKPEISSPERMMCVCEWGWGWHPRNRVGLYSTTEAKLVTRLFSPCKAPLELSLVSVASDTLEWGGAVLTGYIDQY